MNLPYVTSEIVSDLDEQLTRLGCSAAHVAPGPLLLGLGPRAIPLQHQQLDSYLQAELIVARVNALQGATDAERTQLFAALQEVACSA